MCYVRLFGRCRCRNQCCRSNLGEGRMTECSTNAPWADLVVREMSCEYGECPVMTRVGCRQGELVVEVCVGCYLPPDSPLQFLQMQPAVCVKPEREGGTHFSTVGGGEEIIKSVKRKVTLCRGLPFTTLILLLLPLQFDVSDAMHRLHRMYI